MAISACMVKWFGELYKKGLLPNGGNILELGPQDVQCPRDIVIDTVISSVDTATATSRLVEVFQAGHTGLDQKQIYRLFGVENYRSLDIADPRADWLADLNHPVEIPQKFDLVTNFGTAEHIFNIGEAFKNIDSFLREDGIALHVLPTFLDIDHGFYNIHPGLYLDMAKANQYAVESLLYIDNFGVRNVRLADGDGTAGEFDRLPITAGDILKPDFARRVLAKMVDNLSKTTADQLARGGTSGIQDYCFVALRKKARDGAPFAYPTQRCYLP